MLSFGAAPASSCGRGNSSALPDYLPEEEDDVPVSDKVSGRHWKLVGFLDYCLIFLQGPVNWSNFFSLQAIARVGGDNKENGWLSSVSSFFSKTLYW